VWLRLLLVLAFGVSVARVAAAETPPPSFFEGRSVEELRVLASDPKNDGLLRRAAATRLVVVLTDAGQFDAADAAGRSFGQLIDHRAVDRAHAARRRSRVHTVALAGLGVVLGVGLLSLVAGRRRLPETLRPLARMAPVMAVFLIHVALVGGYLAAGYENGDAAPFVLFAALMVPLLVMFRAWSAVGSTDGAARGGRAAAAVVATVCMAFLLVEHINPAYLGSFGL